MTSQVTIYGWSTRRRCMWRFLVALAIALVVWMLLAGVAALLGLL